MIMAGAATAIVKNLGKVDFGVGQGAAGDTVGGRIGAFNKEKLPKKSANSKTKNQHPLRFRGGKN